MSGSSISQIAVLALGALVVALLAYYMYSVGDNLDQISRDVKKTKAESEGVDLQATSDPASKTAVKLDADVPPHSPKGTKQLRSIFFQDATAQLDQFQDKQKAVGASFRDGCKSDGDAFANSFSANGK